MPEEHSVDARRAGRDPHRGLKDSPLTLLELWRHTRVFLVIVFGLCVWGVSSIDTQVWQAPAFVVEMRSDTATAAQLFYDIGRGINEADSVRLPVKAANAYALLRFPLPRAAIRALRFDPLDGPGSFAVRRAYIADSSDSVIRQFSPNDLIATNQIATRADTGSEVKFTTVPSANDPTMQIVLHGPLNLSEATWKQAVRVSIQLVVCVLITALAAAGYLVAQPRLRAVGRVLDLVARSVSDSEFLPFDRLAIGCYLSIAAFFVLSVSAGFHGSAISLYSTDGSVQPIIGTGKRIRSDEWAYHTPAILHQVYRATPFEAKVSMLGSDYTALIANVPVRHFTMVLRPQFWGFFFLSPSYAFAFYWQFKALLLLTGVFSLLLLLTHSSRIAAFGALWYGFSPYIQWAYSWASLLPEMIGLFCIVMCSMFYMSLGRRPVLLILAALMCVVGAVDFAVSAYIPHQIPLVWLGGYLCIWWMVVKWKSIFTPDRAWARVAALGGAWLVVGVIMLFFFRDAEAAVTGIANTVYPGRRSWPGGTYPVVILWSHFFSFWEDESHFPLLGIFRNICESAGFFWLAPVTLFGWRSVRAGEVDKKWAYWVLVVFAALLFSWLTLPVPRSIGRAIFMDKTGVGSRSLHVLGLVNVALVTLYLSVCRTQNETERRWRDTLVLGAAVFANVYPVFLLVNSSVANLLTGRQLVVAAGYATVLVVAVVENRFRVLAACLVFPQIAVFGLVNPLDRGLQVVESAPLFRFVHSHPELLRHRWIVFSGSYPHFGFFSAVGCDVVNGLKYVPDLKALSVFDPTGEYQALINQSRWLIAEPEYGNRPVQFDEPRPDFLRLRVSPLNPALRHIGVRYAAFADQPPAEIAARMKPLSTAPVSGFWLYELPG